MRLAVRRWARTRAALRRLVQLKTGRDVRLAIGILVSVGALGARIGAWLAS